MFTTVLVFHIIVSLLLVLVVLLQAGRGAELGAAFGGVGQSSFGRGPATFVEKFTTTVAIVFMLTSLSLAFLTTNEPGNSVIRQPVPVAAPAPVEAAPEVPVEVVPEGTPLEQTDAPPATN